MIIKKNDNGTYVCEKGGNYFTIDSKESYITQKQELIKTPKPKDKELIELGKQIHPYYQLENSLLNIDNQLLEIEEFENGNDKL